MNHFITVLSLLCLLKLSLLGEINYNKDIRPILSDKCIGCHGADLKEAKAKLQLHTFDTATKPLGKNKDRWAIYPKDLSKSEVWHRIMTDDEDEVMPPTESHKTLTAREKDLIKQWIESGAEYEEHWSFKKLGSVAIPKVKNTARVNNKIDHFIISKIDESELSLSAQADPSILIRRLYLDLTGLPAPIKVMEGFAAHPSQQNYETIVDELLNSPQYAERMTLDWLDKARYADTNGYSIDDHRDMWAWRDWVIDAFAKNKPYDEFILEQVAGDLLPNASVQQKIATGFLRNSMSTHEGGTIAEEYRVAYTKDKVDVVATTVMGLTMKCAQCHDHKYDPISQKEYYQFYAYFNSSSEGGKGGTNGNASPMIKSISAFCDETRLEAEMDQRIADLEKTIFESIPDFEIKRQQWSEKVLSQWKKSQQQKSNEVQVVKASLKPKAAKLNWIWSERPVKHKKVEFKKSIKLSGVPTTASLSVSCDNSATVYINKKKVGETKDWQKPLYKEISKFLRRGENIITVKAENISGPAGLVCEIEIKEDNSRTIKVSTDETWLAKAGDAKEYAQAKVIEAYGKGPWGKVFENFSNSERLATLIKKGFENLSRVERKELYDTMILDLKLETIFIKTVKQEIGVLEKIKKEKQVSTMIMDHKERETFILTRGEYDKPAEKVSPGFPAFLPAPNDEEMAPNRLGLAKWLTRKDHPLTARVMVNRVWQMIMGRGLVETSEDFGAQGSWPVQEDLLNFLAYEFVENNWDIKKLIKTIVMSSTYQQSSKTTTKQKELDPRNDLFSRAPRFRLAAEIIRDKTLYHAGLINPKVGGPSVYPGQPDNLWKKISHYGYGRPFTAQVFIPSRGKDLFRKSMYTFWKRTLSPPNMTIFDAPTRETCSARRLTTNTPLQALVLMNDPQYFGAARQFGTALYEDKQRFDVKIKRAYHQVTGHSPNEPDMVTLGEMFKAYHGHFQKNQADATELLEVKEVHPSDPEQAAYIMFASTLLNLDEAITRQ